MSGSSISNGGFLCGGGGRLANVSSNCDDDEEDAMIAVGEESNRVEPEGMGVLLPLFGAAGFGTPRFLLAPVQRRGYYVRAAPFTEKKFTSSGCAYVSLCNSFPRAARPVCFFFDTSPHRLRSAAAVAAAMMLRAARKAGPLLRLSSTGSVGERIRGGVPSTPAVFTRGFLDFFKTGDKEATEKKAKARARLSDELRRGYFDDISEIRKNDGKIAVANKVIIPVDDAVKFPDLALESPVGGALRLPLVASPPGDGSPEAAGTVVPDASLVCLSFRASSQKMVESWSLPFLDAFGAAGKVQAYEVSFIDSWLLSSSPMRRAFLKVMRKSDNPQRHAVYAFGDHYDFRKQLQIVNLLTGYIYLVDRLGRIRWQGFGHASQEELSSLKACTSILLDEK